MKNIKKKIWIALVSSLFFANASFSYSNAELNSANFLAKKWIIVDKSFDPKKYNLDKNVLRQEIAAISLWISWVQKSQNCQNLFNDISNKKPNSWICFVVEPLANAWLIAKNKFFKPETNVSKAEAVGIIVKATFWDKYNANNSLGYSWQKQVVDFAAKEWILENFSDYEAYATRWFIFEMAKKAIEKNWKIENKIIQSDGKNLTLEEIEKKVKKVVDNQDENIFYNASLDPNKKYIHNVKAGEDISDYILYKHKDYTDFISKFDFYTKEEIEKKLEKIDLWSDILYDSLNDSEKKYLENIIIKKDENISDYAIFKIPNKKYKAEIKDYISKIKTSKNLSQIREEMLKQLNNYRIENGKNPLKINENLNQAAQAHAKDLFINDIFWHNWSDWSKPSDRALKAWYSSEYVWENVAFNIDVEKAMEAWKKSKWHNENMLRDGFSEVWFGFYGNNWVQVFWRN